MANREKKENNNAALEQYSKYKVRYKLDGNDDCFSELNQKYQVPMQDALAAVGVLLEVKDEDLQLSLDPESYARARDGHAGRNKKRSMKGEDQVSFYRYSDIVLLMQSMTDRDLAAHINMPIATFYRHKKELKESFYYKSLDKNRLTDAEYLKDVPGNLPF